MLKLKKDAVAVIGLEGNTNNIFVSYISPDEGTNTIYIKKEFEAISNRHNFDVIKNCVTLDMKRKKVKLLKQAIETAEYFVYEGPRGNKELTTQVVQIYFDKKLLNKIILIHGSEFKMDFDKDIRCIDIVHDEHINNISYEEEPKKQKTRVSDHNENIYKSILESDRYQNIINKFRNKLSCGNPNCQFCNEYTKPEKETKTSDVNLSKQFGKTLSESLAEANEFLDSVAKMKKMFPNLDSLNQTDKNALISLLNFNKTFDEFSKMSDTPTEASGKDSETCNNENKEVVIVLENMFGFDVNANLIMSNVHTINIHEFEDTFNYLGEKVFKDKNKSITKDFVELDLKSKNIHELFHNIKPYIKNDRFDKVLIEKSLLNQPIITKNGKSTFMVNSTAVLEKQTENKPVVRKDNKINLNPGVVGNGVPLGTEVNGSKRFDKYLIINSKWLDFFGINANTPESLVPEWEFTNIMELSGKVNDLGKKFFRFIKERTVLKPSDKIVFTRLFLTNFLTAYPEYNSLVFKYVNNKKEENEQLKKQSKQDKGL